MCWFGCKSDSGSSTASQGANQPSQSGSTTGTSNGGTCTSCCPSFNIRSQTVATQPSSRTRTTIGIGEEVNLSTDPSTSVTWSIDGDDGHKGTLSRASGSTTKYTACDRAKSVTIKGRNHCGNESTITFSVIQPSGAILVGTDTSNVNTIARTIVVGFRGKPYAPPSNVSFYNTESKEGACPSTATGVFASQNGIMHADGGSFIPASDTVISSGTYLQGDDTVQTAAHPFSLFPAGGTTDGRFLWPIPWIIQVRGGGTNGSYTFDTLNHLKEYDSGTRNLRMSKGGASANRTVPT